MKTLMHPVRYSHSVKYNGVRKDLNGRRMTLRIEQVTDNQFLVTRSICSSGDNFVKATGRRLADLKKTVHESCTHNSEYYGPDTLLSRTINIKDNLTLTITPWIHSDFSRRKDKHIADEIDFYSLDPLPDTKTLIEMILDSLSNAGRYPLLNYI